MKRMMYCLVFVFLLSLFAIQTVQAQFTEKDKKMFAEGYVLQHSEIEFAPFTEPYRPTFPKIYSIENRADETVVTFVQPIYFDSQWVSFGYGFCLVDRKSGDVYMTRGYDKGWSMDRLLIVRGCNKRNILIPLVFPKLQKGVNRIDILDLQDARDLIPSNDDGVRRCYYNVNVKKYAPEKKKIGKIYR